MHSAGSLFYLLCYALLVVAHPNHGHISRRSLTPGAWHHPRDHPVNSLFKRADEALPEVGTPTWLAKYPAGTPDASKSPQAWTDALNAAVSAGKIPSVVQSTSPGAGMSPVYPSGTNGLDPSVCSATEKCINPDDIWDAPQGTYGTSFDDGPLPFSIKLLNFLKSNNEGATHFLIGITMVQNVEPFKATLASGNDIAVHTYTHPYMTTLSNADVVAQLGWTMQIIHDSTGGLVPRFWRPPYGDSDNRVRAIAKEVFGLRTVIWNHDTNDWGIPAGSTTPQAINASYTEWLKGPKSPGLIVLEHETSDQSVQAFIDAYPAIKANGWKMSSLASLVDNAVGPYQNVVGGQTQSADILGGAKQTGSPQGGNTPPSSTGGGATPTSSGSTGTGASGNTAASGKPSNAASSAVSVPWYGTAFVLVLGLLGL